MSAFRRRAGGAADAPTPKGVRSAPFIAPVPLLSTGIPALDDILCGGGILAGSVLTLVPCAGTANVSAAELGASARGGELGAVFNEQILAAADVYTDLFLSYVAAQGLASEHHCVVVGESASSFVTHLMGRVDDPEAPNLDRYVERTAEPETPAESLQRMKIAWRYDQPRPAPPPPPTLDPSFTTVFDLSKRISPLLLREAETNHTLTTSSLDTDHALTTAWHTIEQAAKHCQAVAAARKQAPVLRIVVRAFGSPVWMDKASPSDLVRFLLRLRALARSLSMPPADTDTPPIPCLVSVSLSSFLCSSQAQVNVIHRLLHASDACLGLSSFAATPGLCDVFPDFTGALRVFRTPAIGTLTNPSLRASVLRGMASGSAPGSQRGDGGAGGGENNLAFKVKRKRLAIEPLNLDTEGGVSERRTQPPASVSSMADKVPKDVHATPLASAPAEPRPVAAEEPRPAAADPAPTPAPQAPAPPKPFAGLQSLRQRGLALAKDRPPLLARPQDYEF
ncbi:Elongator subunit elp4 [Malassezia caprae]|uniref:Elongator complex protein 4 n=1 Tax=Malassezia caprae TaxID=1381934 RepID=A0AAF0E9S7_9BASI|nr:Elongator subunit elp4 [Malassezia caprae]